MEGLERKPSAPQDVMVRRASSDSQEDVFGESSLLSSFLDASCQPTPH